ncbi:hypothetical protein EYZ11_006345 [Aspergillus tanneri]|uniref:Uncharacterized protein n=1 Tax=Aspergillus tanneri TaxID=1220188 RepID=A0A4S3JG14_9EURO|nr:hypothetical protein EYZ11_006345 [Aspergillus tanneri]
MASSPVPPLRKFSENIYIYESQILPPNQKHRSNTLSYVYPEHPPPSSPDICRTRSTLGKTNKQRVRIKRVLMHVFSNSGGINLEVVCSIWLDLYPNGPPPLPLHALILDSTPSGVSFFCEFPHWTAAFVMEFSFLRRLMAHMISTLMVTFLMGVWPLLQRRESLPARGRYVVNTPGTNPVPAVRLYIYSKTDPFMGHKYVEAHALEANEVEYKVFWRGLQVRTFRACESGSGKVLESY